MAALKFVSEIVSPVSTIVISDQSLPLAQTIVKQLTSRKNLLVKKSTDTDRADVVLYLAGFGPDSLTETVALTSGLHQQLDYALAHKAKFILVMPDMDHHARQTAVGLVKHFSKSTGLDFLIITTAAHHNLDENATAIIQSFIKNFNYEAVAVEVLEEKATSPVPTKSVRKSSPILWGLLVAIITPGLMWAGGMGLTLSATGASYWLLRQGNPEDAIRLAQFAKNLSGPWPRIQRLASTALDLATWEAKPITTNVIGLLEELADIHWPPVDKQVAEYRKTLQTWSLIQPDLKVAWASPKFVWLVLLQDDTELRSTGGYLSNFALITLEKGQITDVQLYDTETTDGLLRGQVEPPVDLAAATQQTSWYLRDSNWDPNFQVVADKTLWFVNKEIGIQGQGVIAVNSKTFGTGDYQALLKKITTLPKNQQALFLSQVVDLIARRQLLISLGGVSNSVAPNCATYTLCDFVYVIDSNVGVNKINAKIQPKYDLQAELNDQQVIYHYKLTYTNSSTSEDYKNYVRLLKPLDEKLDQVNIAGESKSASQSGWLVTVPAGTTKTLEIVAHRTINPSIVKAYQLDWLNQPGQPDIPLTIATLGQVKYNGSLNQPVHLWQPNIN